MLIIDCYDDFIEALLRAGFSMSGGNAEGVYSAIPVSWGDPPGTGGRIRWHTGDPDTDPWEWRLRVLNERDDVAYAKMFFRKGGYITREWYPYFLSARRAIPGGGSIMDFDEEYGSGALSHYAKRIYSVVNARGAVPLDGIKTLGGFGRQEKSKFDSALVELQMRLYITICGELRKMSKDGKEYGWPTTMLCTSESFWGAAVFDEAAKIPPEAAYESIKERILELNSHADPNKIDRFISG